MSYGYLRVTCRRGGSTRNTGTLVLLLLVACAMIPAGYVAIRGVIHRTRDRLESQLRQVKAELREHKDTLEKLAFHENRLSSSIAPSSSYRIPILVEGRSTYVSIDATGMEEAASALALEDLLNKQRGRLIGSFHSGDSAEWLFALVEISQEAGNHVMTTDLPAIHKRMEEMRRKKDGLESRQARLREKLAKATY